MGKLWRGLKFVPLFGIVGWGFLLWVFIPIAQQQRERGYSSFVGELVLIGGPVCGLLASFAIVYLRRIGKTKLANWGTGLNVVGWLFLMFNLLAAAAI